MPRKTRKNRGKGSDESRAKGLITSEVLVKHLSHIFFMFFKDITSSLRKGRREGGSGWGTRVYL